MHHYYLKQQFETQWDVEFSKDPKKPAALFGTTELGISPTEDERIVDHLVDEHGAKREELLVLEDTSG